MASSEELSSQVVQQRRSTGVFGLQKADRERIGAALKEATLCIDTQRHLRGVLMQAGTADISEDNVRKQLDSANSLSDGDQYTEGVIDALRWILGEGHAPYREL